MLFYTLILDTEEVKTKLEQIYVKYQNQYENKEIAEMFGISEESVRKRISRGKAKLEEILKERGVL